MSTLYSYKYISHLLTHTSRKFNIKILEFRNNQEINKNYHTSITRLPFSTCTYFHSFIVYSLRNELDINELKKIELQKLLSRGRKIFILLFCGFFDLIFLLYNSFFCIKMAWLHEHQKSKKKFSSIFFLNFLLVIYSP